MALSTQFFYNFYYQLEFFIKSQLNTTGIFYAGSLCISSILMRLWIGIAATYCKSVKREYTPEQHLKKVGVPTMGGIIIIANMLLITFLAHSFLAWPVLGPQTMLILVTLILFGGIGLWDDMRKIRGQKGISERQKFVLQSICSAIILGFWCTLYPEKTGVYIPGWHHQIPVPFIVGLLWRMFVMIGASNAVNLADGLDGLAVGSLVPNFAAFALIALYSPALLGGSASGELAFLGFVLAGQCLIFWYFNRYPAHIILGDVGALSLGAALALLAIMTRQELLLALSGLFFVMETVSVMIQVTVYRYTKQRVFRMAPIHHHFELLGYSEKTITTFATALSCIACAVAMYVGTR